MRRGIVFDFDGVIINSSEVQKKALFESYRMVVGDNNLPSFEEFVSHSGESLSGILKKMNLPLSMVEPYRNISRSNMHRIRVYEGIVELIMKLRNQGYKCALCTGKDRKRTIELLENLNILKLFDCIVCSDDVANPKPSPDSLILAINDIGVSTENALLVGDAINDIICAKNSGIVEIAVTWGEFSEKELKKYSPDYIVNTMDNLYDVIKEHFNKISSALKYPDNKSILSEDNNKNCVCYLVEEGYLPADYLGSDIKSSEVDNITFVVDRKIADGLNRISKECGLDFNIVLLAVLNILLSKYNMQEEIVVNILADKQYPNGIRNSFDTNTYEIKNRPKGEMVFNEFLKQVKESTVECIPELEEIHNEKSKIKSNTNRFNQMLSAKLRDELTLEINYYTSINKKNTIERFAKHFLNILKQIVKDQNIRLSEIEGVCNEEKNEFIYGFNNTYSQYPRNKTIHELFEEQVVQFPNNVALEFGGIELSYKELNEKSNQLARRLREKGVTSGSLVGVMVKHSFEMIIGILSVLKAGGAYVPIDPEYPKERIKYILQDTGIDILLTQSDLKDSIEFNRDIIILNDRTLFEGDISNISLKNTSSDLAYIIYTSGSTGNPKGVMVTHQGLVNYIKWAQKVYLNCERHDFPLYSSISFDFTITSIFTPLLSGNRVVIYSQTFIAFLLRRMILEGKVSIIKLTPTHLKLLEILDIKNSSVRKLIVGGEDLKTELAKKIYEKFDNDVEIYNEYGPTEAVVGCMIHKYNPMTDTRSSVPIGIPSDNVRIYLLDNYLKFVPQGVVGEIYISGDGVAKGYLNQPGLTEERFVQDPYHHCSRMYRTGDLARRLENGDIEFVRRIDNQIKIKGFRIEPGEIEARILLYRYIKDSAVIVKKNWDNSDYLCAYYVSEREIDTKELRSYLCSKLPDYMVPLHFIQIKSMPLNQNGKLDKKALLELGEKPVHEDSNESLENCSIHNVRPTQKYLVNDLVIAEKNCNMNCAYCLTDTSEFKEQYKSCNKLKSNKILNYLKDTSLRDSINGISNIITDNFDVAILKVSGGEVLMIKEILEYIMIQATKYKVVQLLTNGLLLNEKILKELKAIGNVCIQMSLDHHTIEGNRYRTSDIRVLDKILRSLENVLKYQIPLEINCVLTDKNTSIISDFADYLLKYRNNNIMVFPFPVRGVNRELFYPKPEQLVGIEKLIENYGDYEDIMAPKIYLEHLLGFLKKGSNDITCIIPRLTIGTFDDGTVTPCSNYWFTSLGNLLGENKSDIVDKIGNDKIYKLLLNSKNMISACKKCFTPWETLNLYSAGLISIEELCRSPLYGFPGVKEHIISLVDKMANEAGNYETLMKNL